MDHTVYATVVNDNAILAKRELHKRHRDDKWIDEVKIETIIRWKESELSGDQFRTSVRVQLIRKGRVLIERGFGDMNTAVMYLPSMMATPCPAEQPWDDDTTLPDDGSLYGDGIMCDQVGCKELGTKKRTLINEYSNDGFKRPSYGRRHYRVFCLKHSGRGDYALEDADNNYEENREAENVQQ